MVKKKYKFCLHTFTIPTCDGYFSIISSSECKQYGNAEKLLDFLTQT